MFLLTAFLFPGLFQIYDMHVYWSRNWRYSIRIHFKIDMVKKKVQLFIMYINEMNCGLKDLEES